MGYKVGRECKLYYAVGGIGGTPTYVLLPIVKNPTLNLSKDEAEVDDRSSDYTRYKGGQKKADLEIEISRKVGDTGYKILRDAFLDDDVIGIAMASGLMATVGEEVFEADYIVTAFPIGEPLNEAGSISVTLKLAADSTNPPVFSDVSA